ncbi:hypothetical protein QCA50_004529 [Cerrena zonata]|uniref:RING-type domain-containing protein n=1 Tax=Cerrena zonata TaxID=2478898 RepID=A0AAW0GM41_9APHY
MAHRQLRSGSRQPLQPTRSNSHVSFAQNDEVIVLSSDDEGPSMPKKRPRRAAKGTTARLRPTTPATIVEDPIEISSGDETPLRDSSDSIVEMRNKIKALEEEVARLRSREVQAPPPTVSPELTAAVEFKKKILEALDDQLCCEICTLRMWTPYTLGCGHMFCQTCLQDWFDSILTKHRAEDPNYEASTHALTHYHEMLRNPRLAAHQRRYIEDNARAIQASMKQPAFTCPTCRVATKDKPIEIYTLKQVVRTISEAMGESSPKKILPPRGSKEIGPWDRFFPAPLVLP